MFKNIVNPHNEKEMMATGAKKGRTVTMTAVMAKKINKVWRLTIFQLKKQAKALSANILREG